MTELVLASRGEARSGLTDRGAEEGCGPGGRSNAHDCCHDIAGRFDRPGCGAVRRGCSCGGDNSRCSRAGSGDACGDNTRFDNGGRSRGARGANLSARDRRFSCQRGQRHGRGAAAIRGTAKSLCGIASGVADAVSTDCRRGPERNPPGALCDARLRSFAVQYGGREIAGAVVVPGVNPNGFTPEMTASPLLCRAHRTQKLHQLLADFVRRFVLYPVADIVEFEAADKARKAGVH